MREGEAHAALPAANLNICGLSKKKRRIDLPRPHPASGHACGEADESSKRRSFQQGMHAKAPVSWAASHYPLPYPARGTAIPVDVRAGR